MTPKPSPGSSRILLTIVLIGLGFLVGVAVGRVDSTATATNVNFLEAIGQAFSERSVPADPSIFRRVWDLIDQEYVGQPVDDQQLYYGAVKGIVDVLGDRYSSFFSPRPSEAFKESLDETAFDGIGAELGVRDETLVVIAPLPGSPAEQAGLRAGDAILAIDGVTAIDMTVDEAVERIRGEGGTTVTLTVGRQGETEAFDVALVRATIVVNSVRWEMRATPAGQPVAYVRISHFTEETPQLFAQAVQEVLLNQPAAFLLDLQNNPGGFLDASIQVAGHFLAENTPVLIEERVNDATVTLRTSGTPTLAGVPAVVLVNEGSASASEILAGALQDYDAATLIGEQTFGKGRVQTFEEFADGSSLKLTVATWATPLGRQIDGKGITPDIVVEPDNAALDASLDRALQFLDERADA
ncbi:MAG: S41 family peptidase [Candidatus Kerfeldbacteria bacterium]|nr:S41 family peptidase [Candidatus Kerfeldbacteria bacterium]